MLLQSELDVKAICIQKMTEEPFSNAGVAVSVLRLDKIHPVISGNKWFKLKYWLQQAIKNNCNTIATFGGAFSNHILATAYACNKLNMKCIGFIRGEEPKHYSQTLLDAHALNMQLRFLSRAQYTEKESIMQANSSMFFIPEGGYGKTGCDGAAEILQLVPNLSAYTHIICAVGTGTMLAGIANASLPHQQCIGISVMKNNFSLEKELFFLADDEAAQRIKLLHDHHFGGYAKHTQTFIDFMNKTWLTHKLPLDFIYTAKALYAVHDLVERKYFSAGANILFIHSGGLQGNRSLQKDTLLYQ